MIVLLIAGGVIGYGLTPLIRLIKMLQNETENPFRNGESGDETDFDVAN